MPYFQIAVGALALFVPALTVRAAEDAVQKAEKAWASAAGRNDHAALERLISDQLLYGHSNGMVENKSEYLDKIRNGTRKYQSVEHENLVVKLFGETAMVHATVRFRGTSQNKPFDDLVVLLHLWVRQDGRWQLAGHQSAPLRK